MTGGTGTRFRLCHILGGGRIEEIAGISPLLPTPCSVAVIYYPDFLNGPIRRYNQLRFRLWPLDMSYRVESGLLALPGEKVPLSGDTGTPHWDRCASRVSIVFLRVVSAGWSLALNIKDSFAL